MLGVREGGGGGWGGGTVEHKELSLLQNGYCVENLNEIHSQLFDGSPLPVKVVILSLYNAHACLSIAKL